MVLYDHDGVVVDALNVDCIYVPVSDTGESITARARHAVY